VGDLERRLEGGEHVFVRIAKQSVGQLLAILSQRFRQINLLVDQLDLASEMQRQVRRSAIRAKQRDREHPVVTPAAVAHEQTHEIAATEPGAEPIPTGDRLIGQRLAASRNAGQHARDCVLHVLERRMLHYLDGRLAIVRMLELRVVSPIAAVGAGQTVPGMPGACFIRPTLSGSATKPAARSPSTKCLGWASTLGEYR
jgi:hypothetical protein